MTGRGRSARRTLPRRAARRAAALAALALLYLAMVGSLDPWAVAQAAVASAAALTLARPQLASLRSGHGRSWRHLARLAARSARDAVAGSFKVGLAAAGLRPLPEPAWVEVSVGERPPADPGALGLLETLSPGTYLVDFDEERRVMLFHVFDAADAEALRRLVAPALRGGEGAEAAGPEAGGGRP